MYNNNYNARVVPEFMAYGGTPDINTNTYGRSGFSIHGGWSKGSAGCIDIPWQTNKLNDFMDNCQDSVPVYVNYPKESW